VSQPPYPYGNPQDPASQPPSDPFQTGVGYPPPFPDPAYPDPAYQQATQPGPYPPTQQYHQGQPGQPGYQPGQYPVYGPQPTYDYSTAVVPPRNGATVTIIVLVALLVLVVGGGVAAVYLWPKGGTPSAQGSHSPAASNSPTPASPTPASPSPAPGPTHTGDLRTFLVSKPGGLKSCTPEEGTDGQLSLDQAANLSSDPTTRADELRRYHFTGGAYNCWIAADKSVVDIRLYQFDSTDAALGFFNTDVKATTSAGQVNDVSGVPGGKTAAKAGNDGTFTIISIGLRGDVVLVVALRQPAPAHSSVADQYLSQQYDKL
jgi:hypothetical protein